VTTKHKEVYKMKTVDYREMLRLEALGYSRARIAARVRKPQDKSHAENSVPRRGL